MSKPIEIQRKVIEGRGDGPHLLVTGGVHGDEFEPMAAVRRLIRSVDPAKLRGKLTAAPAINEAAFRNKDRWAEDELDLARVCPGDPNGSVTMRTAHALSELIRTADYYIDLHTGGTTLTVIPMSGYSLHDDAGVLETQRQMAQAFNLPLIWGTQGKLDGRSLSIARDAMVPAIYTEYHGSAVCDPQGVVDYTDGCLNVMGWLNMIDRERPPSRVEHVVEDERDNAGHMQLQNRSPVEGFFEPAVTLGQRVKAGDPIGRVSDVLGDRVETVRSHQDGIVLTLKTFSRVDEGDSVGVIVEADRPLGG